MRRCILLLVVALLTACSQSTGSTPTQHIQTALPATAFPATGAVTQVASTGTMTAPTQQALSFPDPAGYTWTELAGGLHRPVDLQNAGDGSSRLFVLEQAGRILILSNGTILPAPFLDIVDKVGSSGNEQGLLGLAFHPNFEKNGFFFINYTDQRGDTVIARYSVSGDPNIADAASETVLVAQDQPFPNHNGGVLAFGPDGFLYAGLGDGGSAGDPFGNGQKTDTLLGKVLRIDVNSGTPYAIPADNPFGSEVWAYGLRNPWRLSFDSATGDLYIGDVGQGEWEEINFLQAGSSGGANFGWSLMEGNHPYNGGNQAGLTGPVAEYSHSETGGCSVTGGYVYRGQALPEWQGIYLFGDYCNGMIWGLLRNEGSWQNQVLFETNFNISSFGLDENGELYLTDLSGSIYRLDKK